jgi:hypothetical protein
MEGNKFNYKKDEIVYLPSDDGCYSIRRFDWNRIKGKVISFGQKRNISFNTISSILYGIGGSAGLSIIPINMADNVPAWINPFYGLITFFSILVAIIFTIIDSKTKKNNHIDIKEIEKEMEAVEKMFLKQIKMDDEDSQIIPTKLITLNPWVAKANKNNLQWTDYKEIDLHGNLLEYVSCNIEPLSDYIRFGFKLLDKNASLFGQTGIPSPDNSCLLHIGKGINNNILTATIIKGNQPQGERKNIRIGEYKNGNTIKLKLEINNLNKLDFYINEKNTYQTQINHNVREKLYLLAWGDNHEFALKINNIEIKTE